MDEEMVSVANLEQQRELWLKLAACLEQAQSALLSGDVAAYERSTLEQQDCCDRLRSLPASAAQEVPATALFDEIARAQQRVRHLNRMHAALLRRAIRGLRIMQNLMMRTEAEYSPQRPNPTFVSSRG